MPETPDAVDSPYNPQFLLESLENDQQMFDHVLSLFIQDYPNNLKKIQEAVSDQSPENLFSAVHHLRGELLTLGREIACEIAEALENAARTKDLTQAQNLIERLDKSVQPILKYIKQRQSKVAPV